VRKEALISLANSCCTGQQPQVDFLLQNNILELLLSGLDCCDTALLLSLLQGIQAVLYYGRVIMKQNNYLINPIVEKIFMCDGHKRIETLQENKNEKIYKTCLEIIDTYFDHEDKAVKSEDESGAYIEGETEMNFEV
jgi:hypothetical protein